MKEYVSMITLEKSTKGAHVYRNKDFSGIYIPKTLDVFDNLKPVQQLEIVIRRKESKADASPQT
jgi:hypothetical protein